MDPNPSWNQLKVANKALWAGEWYVSDGNKIVGPYDEKAIFDKKVWNEEFGPGSNIQICQKGYSKWYPYGDLDNLHRFALVKDDHTEVLKNQIIAEKDRVATNREAQRRKQQVGPSVQGKQIGTKAHRRPVNEVPAFSKSQILKASKSLKKSRSKPKHSNLEKFQRENKEKGIFSAGSIAFTKTSPIIKTPAQSTQSEKILSRVGVERLGKRNPILKTFLLYILSFGTYTYAWYASVVRQIGRHLDGSHWQVSPMIKLLSCLPIFAMIPGKKLIKLLNVCEQRDRKRPLLLMIFMIPPLGMMGVQYRLNKYWSAKFSEDL